MKVQLCASLLALTVAAPAFAFDTVTWDWDADVVSTVTTSALSDVAVVSTGLEQIETEQLSLGDFAATSSSLGITNTALGGLGGAIVLDDVLAINTKATSLGNSASLTSDVSTQFDSSQIFGGAALTLGSSVTGGLADVSVPGLLTSLATTNLTVNSTVDNAATAVANNMNANLTTTSDQDAFLLGNNVQTAYSLGTATSLVDGATFTSVADLGTLVDPGISSVATALGNNLGVTIDGIN